MANLASVQLALKQGDKKKAMQLLKTILKEKPSADAWYLAAKLAANNDTAIQYLQRALSMDSNHVKARDMLRELGGEYKSLKHSLREAVVTGMQDFGKNYPLLRQLTPQQRMIFTGGLFAVIGIVFVILLVNLLTPDKAPEPLPERVASVVTSNSLVERFDASELDIASIEHVAPPADTPVTDKLVLAINDPAGVHEVTILIYGSGKGIVDDFDRRKQEVGDRVSMVNGTAVMIYPSDLDSGVTEMLTATFKSVSS